MYDAVRRLDDECNRLPESRTWSGEAHDAATWAFRRATDQTSPFKTAAEELGETLKRGSDTIGASRRALLHEADAIDEGELYVTDDWVVMIKSAEMSAEKAAELQSRAEVEQAEINRLLLAVGDADQHVAARLQVAVKGVGFQAPDANAPFYGMKDGEIPLGDEVPNPLFPIGLRRQEMLRSQDMATTRRELTKRVDQYGNRVTTIVMQDGSKHVISEPKIHSFDRYGPPVDNHYDKNGQFISATRSWAEADGGKGTEVRFGDGTTCTMHETPGGDCSGEVITSDGRRGILPEKFFADPETTIAGGALTGLEKQAGRGIPILSTSALEKIGAGAKYGGPTLGVLTTLYNAANAQTAQEACVAAWSGGFGTAGGIGADVALGLLAPEAAPILAMGVNAAGTWAFGYVGGIVGNLACAP